MKYPKYINTKTGEVCFTFKELIHSFFFDIKHYFPKALTWCFSWTLFKNYKVD